MVILVRLKQYICCRSELVSSVSKNDFVLTTASATRIYAEALEKLPAVETEEDQFDDDIDKLKRHKADIARCWLKYCLALLNLSK